MNEPDHGVKIETLSAHVDSRGLLVEPLMGAALAEQRASHLVVSNPGAIRGNHFHRHTAEILIVEGPALVRVRVAGGLRDFAVPAGVFQRFSLPPGVSHAVKNTGDHPTVAIAFNNLPRDPVNPDVVRDELISI